MSKKTGSWTTKDGALKFSIEDGQLEVADTEEGDVVVLAVDYDQCVEAQDILTKALVVMAALPRKPVTEAAEDDLEEESDEDDELEENDLNETDESEEDETED